MNINERMISLDEVIETYKNKNELELFGAGTAAIISSISKLKYNDLIMRFDENNAGELSTKLYEEILGIQLGTREDKHSWLSFIE
jgi:branched-chain amino acid aminotransferase